MRLTPRKNVNVNWRTARQKHLNLRQEQARHATNKNEGASWLTGGVAKKKNRTVATSGFAMPHQRYSFGPYRHERQFVKKIKLELI